MINQLRHFIKGDKYSRDRIGGMLYCDCSKTLTPHTADDTRYQESLICDLCGKRTTVTDQHFLKLNRSGIWGPRGWEKNV